jgi:hypothetical protein
MSVHRVLNSSKPSLPDRSTSIMATMLRHTSFEKPSFFVSGCGKEEECTMSKWNK